MALEVLCRKRGLGKVIRKSASWIPVNPFLVPGAMFFFTPGSPETSMGPTGIYADDSGTFRHFPFKSGVTTVDTGWPCGLVSGSNLHTGEYLLGAYFLAVAPGEHTITAKILQSGGSMDGLEPSSSFDYAPWCAEVMSMTDMADMGGTDSAVPFVFLLTPLRERDERLGVNKYYGQRGPLAGEPSNYAMVTYYSTTYHPIFPRSIMILNAEDPWFPDNPIIDVRIAVGNGGEELFLADFPQTTLEAIVPGKKYLLPQEYDIGSIDPVSDVYSGGLLEVLVNDHDFYGSGTYTIEGRELSFHGSISVEATVKIAYYPSADDTALRAVFTKAVSYPVVHHLSDTGGNFYMPSDYQGVLDNGHTEIITVKETSLVSLFMSWGFGPEAAAPMGGINATVRFTIDGHDYDVSADTDIGEWGWTPPGSGDAPPGPLA